MLRRPLNAGLILSLFLFGCKKEQPNAFKCVVISESDFGETLPVDQWTLFCKNPVTEVVKEFPIGIMNACIGDHDRPCKWIATDLENYERMMRWAQKQCKGNL